ncbi:MAG: phosphatidylserine decarboxylase family protein [Desulfofustis sp.]|nr:phosphatidylserine decarboxylase family protein [Desulfofustis sp.]
MLKERIPIAREGIPFIGYAAFLTLISAVLDFPAATLVLLVISTFVLMFFRDPERVIPPDSNAVISPADGKVIVVEQVVDERFFTERVWKISIFMNVFNVHVNRIPIAGTVETVRHVPGAFLAADNKDAHLKNEFCAVTIRTRQDARLTVVQIAGLIARRIVCRTETGDQVLAGQRYGLIRFGSRLDVYLPITATITTEVGQTSRSGETILARLN